MAARRAPREAARQARTSRAPEKTQRRILTQTRTRDLIVQQAETVYLEEHARLVREADDLLAEWVLRNARTVTDVGEKELLRKMRGVFNRPENMRRVFGRLASLVQQDVETTLRATIPGFDREDFAEPEAVQRWIQNNTGLISSVGELLVGRVAKAIEGGEGKHVETLSSELRAATQATESRTKLWARDQTLKLHADITKDRHQKVGIRRYYWTDSNDERVRRVHGALGDRSDRGEVFEYRDPPVMSKDGRRGNPGEDYQCRCTAFPVLE